MADVVVEEDMKIVVTVGVDVEEEEGVDIMIIAEEEEVDTAEVRENTKNV